jgi:NADH dehydrogenase
MGEAFEYASRPDVKDQPNLAEPERAIRRKERQRRLTFAIVGGGPTGVELAGELADFAKDITKPRVGAYPQLEEDVRIVVIHGGPALVPQFDEDLTKLALESLQKEGVEVRLNTFVNEVGDGSIKIIPKGEGQVEEELKCGLTIWAAGTEPVPFVKSLLEKLPEEAKGIGGKISVDNWQRCPMPKPEQFGSILVMGDASAFPDGDTYLPQTAQVAGQQGAYVARLLDRDYDLSVTPPLLRSDDRGMMELWLKMRGLEKADGCKFFAFNDLDVLLGVLLTLLALFVVLFSSQILKPRIIGLRRQRRSTDPGADRGISSR